MHAHDGRIDHLDGRGPTEMEGKVIDLKRRIPILKRLIADCDRLAADLEQEVRNEEHRVKIHEILLSRIQPTPRRPLIDATI